jgi:hypothetical protein
MGVDKQIFTVLRAVAEGKVRWAFWPPDMDVSSMDGEQGNGIWIPHVADGDDESEFESEDEAGEESVHSEETSESEENPASEDEGQGDDEVAVQVTRMGRFGALTLDDGVVEEEEEAESEGDEK